MNPLLNNDPYRDQNLRLMQQGGMDIPGQRAVNRQQQLATVREFMREEAHEQAALVNQAFQDNLQQFLQLNPDNFSVTKAIYLAESAYDPNLLPFEQFEGAIKEWASLVKQIIKREGLSLSSNTAVNYAIQKLYSLLHSVPSWLMNLRCGRDGGPEKDGDNPYLIPGLNFK